MCGIICISSCDNTATRNKLLNYLDVFKGNISRRGPDNFDMKLLSLKNGCELLFGASVLWLQGRIITQQPLENKKAVFLYNGDIYEGLTTGSDGTKSDTLELFELFNQTGDIIHTLENIHGPYAFIYFDKEKEKLYFSRDPFGRKSLLIGKHCGNILLTSVACRDEQGKHYFIELPAIGLFCWDLKSSISLHPFDLNNNNFKGKLTELETFLGQSIILEETILQKCKRTEFVEPLPDQLDIYKNIENMSIENSFSVLLKDENWIARIENLKRLLKESLRKRISAQPSHCRDCIKEHQECNHCLVGILFSGGVDCSILALLADEIVEKTRPIDLFNVAFDKCKDYKTPDRQTGLETLEELKKLCPEREWRFFEVNISKEELDKQRVGHIADLIYPLRTILDDSLGCALWFASKGVHPSVQSPCRVLLVGMGADELFGGYTRHRVAFKKKSWLGLHTVLNEDWENLPYRNLARDDRVVSDHGRQLRMPYLDEKLVDFIRSLPCWLKSYPSHKVPQGFGEKILLRSLAYQIGLKKAAVLKKRALQFGSRIANKNENGHDISLNLK